MHRETAARLCREGDTAMKLAQVRSRTPAERIATLERRADGHDLVIPPMAEQVAEMYGLLTKWRNINWFLVKIGAGFGAALGLVAVVLTIAEKVAHFTGH